MPPEPTNPSEMNKVLKDTSFLTGAAVEAAMKADATGLPHLARYQRFVSNTTKQTVRPMQKFDERSPLEPSKWGDFEIKMPEQVNIGGGNNKPSKQEKQEAAKAQAKAKPEIVRKVVLADCDITPMTDRMKALPEKLKPLAGPGAKNFPDAKEIRYITTAINYTNGWPHIGHAYEGITTDAIARAYRMYGFDTRFQTGTDEHGKKIEQAAEKEGKKPIEICDMYAAAMQGLADRLNISYDKYIRTSDTKLHYPVAQELWKKCKENGDIYLGEYEGWYMVREERHIPDAEAKELDFKDPVNGKPLERIKEDNFMLKTSKYKDKLLKHIEQNPNWIQPKEFREEIKSFLEGEVHDTCISRGTMTWGIPVPEPPVKGTPHVMYVWFDALTNYITGVDVFKNGSNLQKYGSHMIHAIGKDILRFHTVIWGAMLMSAGVELPKSVIVHGFVMDQAGKKMSKSEGNVVDPHDVCDWCPVDSFRWFIVKEAAFGSDMKFGISNLMRTHNAMLCDNLGNLVNRAVTLSGGKVPELKKGEKLDLPFDLKKLTNDYLQAIEESRLGDAADAAFVASSITNKWIADLEPWKIKDDPEKKMHILRYLVEAVYILGHFFAPFTPMAADAIFKKIGTAPIAIPKLKADFLNLKTGTPIESNSVLFKVFPNPDGDPKAQAAPAPSKAAAPKKQADAKAEGKGKKDNKPAPKPKAAPVNMDQPLYSRLDLRVGKIVGVKVHPEAQRLYIEEIDVGEDEPRTIVSGLREHYTLEEMMGRQIVTICNLKPSKLVGVTSHGMVLCAKKKIDGKDKVEFAKLPDNCKPGDPILVEGDDAERNPWEPKQVDKHKVWAAVAEKMTTSDAKICCFDGKALTVNGVKLTSTISGGILS